ncbi:MAG TPA: heat-inducible transcriptional repressor HrcA [Pseudacidobacterium sp.]|jgi:heat-inducible transcriptional repressor|nr:heat-inducible transcriptional repressor HrcA [Pseudacidobacterium sp.]
MSSELRISPRERLVLTAIVETYIASGEPVASQAIARQFADKDGMSSATIRNVMASLDNAGLVDQPHTSAGRIPTAKAFRFYVEQLNGYARLMPLTQERRDQIEDSFAGVNSSQQFLERTSHVLALISSGVGVALAPASDMHALEHIHFTRLAAGRVLAVVVTKAGLVMDRVLALDHDLSHTELEVSARFLNENFHGWPIDRIRGELSRRMEQERNEYDRLMRSVNELYRKGAFDSEGSGQTIFMEGVANLLASEMDRERLRQMLRALEAKQQMVELLNAYVNAHQQTVRVVIGLEEAIPEMQDMVLIGAPARFEGSNFGAVAVIGTTRMRYQETMNAVSYIAQLSDRIFQPPQ